MNAEVKTVESLVSDGIVSEYIATGDADDLASTQRVTALRTGLRIVMHVMGMPFNGETIKEESLGGSETAAYYQARELAKRGHNVTVFTTSIEGGRSDGVEYICMGQPTEAAPLGEAFEHYARHTPHDVLIIQRHPLAFQKQFASKVNIWQLHDLALLRSSNIVNNMMWNIDFVTVVSEWHKKQVCEVYGFDPDFVRVVPNGVDAELYEEGHPLPRIPEDAMAPIAKFRMLYQSRPERGLEHLVRPGGIMDRLRDTKAHLLICGYDNTTGEMADFYGQLNAWADALPNVTRLGALTKPQLAALQKSCDLLVYPTSFCEVSCITAMEAMHAGLPMLTSAVAALPETCKGSGTILIDLKDGKVDEDAFVERLRFEIDERHEQPGAKIGRYSTAQTVAATKKTWTIAIDQLEQTLNAALDARNGTRAAKLRHCIEHSEIDAARALLEVYNPANAIETQTAAEIEQLYAFAESPEAYAAHYAKHQGAYYDGPGEQAIGEDVTHTPRFRGSFMLIAEQLKDKTGLRVLDYGCAHGHYLIPLAKVFPQHTFVGMDISARAIGAAMRWVQSEGLANVELINGAQKDLHELNRALCPREIVSTEKAERGTVLEYGQPQLFDVVFAGEVVEHVPDYQALLEQFRSILKPEGRLVATTPYGRWEWTGIPAFREAREHLHHFDKADIEALCANNSVRIMSAPAGPDQTGAPLGSWLWSTSVEKPFCKLDESVRIAHLAPRETLTACMIVRNGESTLRSCVTSFIDWVDELVIAVDPTTTDRTDAVINALIEEFKWKPIRRIDGLSATEHGFHAARNRSIEQANGDWVMWVDSDEVVQNPQNLWKYLRPSHHQAIGFPQVHYACDPEQVLTTDYPCRLFRNSHGIQFYGFVHEHPETEPGKAIPHAVVKHDVKFLHNGYIDEATRRARYVRNLPLLTRDMKEFPTRKLNKFLWLRDIAQGIAFQMEQQGGAGPAQIEQAQEGIKLFEQLMDEESGNARMLIDALQYYSMCAGCIPGSFEAEFSFACMKEPLRDMAAKANAKGRFHSVDVYYRLCQMLIKEATRHYEDKYL